MRAVSVMALVAAACGVLLAPANPAGLAREAPRPPAFSGPYADDLRRRTSLGLSTDEAFIAGLHAAYRAGDRSLTSGFGIPMSHEELGELSRREQASQVNAPVAQAWAARQRLGVYGGMYLDHLGGGVLTVLVTRDVDRARRELLALVPQPDRVRVRKVEHSRDYLGWVQKQLRVYAFDAGVNASSVDERRNLVIAYTTDVERMRRLLPLIVPRDVIEVAYSSPPSRLSR